MLDLKGDRFAMMKAEYEKAGPEPSNTRYGYVVPNGADRSLGVCVEHNRPPGTRVEYPAACRSTINPPARRPCTIRRG